MKTGDKATIVMRKALKKAIVTDEKVYPCSVLCYEAKQECIYLVLEGELLSSISLDAIYECQIREAQHMLACTGRVLERFNSEPGKILKFRIENGFYKI